MLKSLTNAFVATSHEQVQHVLSKHVTAMAAIVARIGDDDHGRKSTGLSAVG